MVAICNCEDTCLGLSLVGIETHYVSYEKCFLDTIPNLPADINILVISEELANTPFFVDFQASNPQIATLLLHTSSYNDK